MVALYADEAAYTAQRQTMGSMLPATAGEVRAVFAGLPEGRYGIAVFHDIDGDEKLGTNLLGISNGTLRLRQRRGGPVQPAGLQRHRDSGVGRPDPHRRHPEVRRAAAMTPTRRGFLAGSAAAALGALLPASLMAASSACRLSRGVALDLGGAGGRTGPRRLGRSRTLARRSGADALPQRPGAPHHGRLPLPPLVRRRRDDPRLDRRAASRPGPDPADPHGEAYGGAGGGAPAAARLRLAAAGCQGGCHGGRAEPGEHQRPAVRRIAAGPVGGRLGLPARSGHAGNRRTCRMGQGSGGPAVLRPSAFRPRRHAVELRPGLHRPAGGLGGRGRWRPAEMQGPGYRLCRADA